MNEERLQAYLNLIQQLLTCPNGEENQILNQSINLVDGGFVQVCELLAQQFQEAGEENEAGFLRNLAQEVGEYLNASGGEGGETQGDATMEEYLVFLKEALRLTSESNVNPSIVYPFLASQQAKLNPSLIEVIRSFATRSTIIDLLNFANLVQQFPLGQRDVNLEISITIYSIALDFFDRNNNSTEWATIQNNLAIAYSYRIRGERAENLENAIAAYQAALEVRTRTAFPEDWAMTQNNLATAYSDRIRGERAENLENAIAAFQAALEVRTRTAFPEYWADTQNNLAAAYSDRIRGERAKNLENAIAAYQAALSVYTRTAFPEKWATTQNNLGTAYSDRIRGERAENLENAIAAYQAALEVTTRTAFPERWADTQNNLGTAYCYRIRGERAENLENALAAYRAALEVYTRTAFPEKWAGTQNNLATAYRNRIRGERAENLENAIAAYEAALSVYTRTAFPEDWAMTQNNLATAYYSRIRGERAENLENAIAAYQAALEVRTRTAFPQNHAETLFNLGLAYRDASQLAKARDTFAAAIDTVEEIRSGIIIGGEADKQKLAEEWQKLYRNTIEVCLELENYAAALEYAERSKARNLVELLAATRLKPEGISPQVWERYNNLYQKWWNLQQQGDSSASPPDNPSPNNDTRSSGVSSPIPSTVATANPQRLTELRQQIDHFIATEITPHDPKFRFGQQVQPIPYREIQALVDEHTAIVEWYFTSKGIHAFIVTHQGQQPIVVSTDSNALAALEQLKEEYLNDYLKDDNHWRQQLPSYLQRLAEILELNHLISQIPSQYQQLVLVPYRALHLFPLHALPLSETEYLSDKFPQGIRYAPSSQILQLSLSEDTFVSDNQAVSLFAIQNPTADLAYTDIEVEAIQTAFNFPTILKGATASKTLFNQRLTELNETGFAHFSCHGYFNFTNPRISGLILANAQLPATAATEKSIPRIRSRRGEFNADECLTLPEIFNLRFRQCRLVALSACETGITDISTTSDEYISILAGFFFAGARNVLGTLWAVNDVSTAIFMIRFYEILLGETQIPVALALKQTQEWLRQATVADLLKWIKGCQLITEERREEMCSDLTLGWRRKLDVKRYESPYYWAAFCVVGQ